jgi:hypothetical protein
LLPGFQMQFKIDLLNCVFIFDDRDLNYFKTHPVTIYS